jgi:SNF2 family DNA or RNA helicase
MSFIGTLLPYQVEAVDRMCEQGSMLVAYDLGLGKTVLTIAAVERLMDEDKIYEPGLVVCLSSLKYQWANSITKFSDSTSLVIDGTPKQRQAQYAEAMNWETSGVDYIIMNYEQVVNDWVYVSKLPRGFVVLDEATTNTNIQSLAAGTSVWTATNVTGFENVTLSAGTSSLTFPSAAALAIAGAAGDMTIASGAGTSFCNTRN